MKKNRVFKSLFFFIAIGIIGGMSLHSCQKDVEPIHFYTPEAEEMITIKLIDSKSKADLSDVIAQITYPDKSSETRGLSDGILTINIDNREDGDLILKFEKEGFVSRESTININRSGLEEGSNWLYSRKVMLAKKNEAFAVTKGVEIEVAVAGSDARVKFPANCLDKDAMITITKTPSIVAISEECCVLELIKGRMAINSFNFLPEGQTFVEPIEFSFPVPNASQDFEFVTWVNGKWEIVPVKNNGDGTGTALISHFSNYILTFLDEFRYEGTVMSAPVQFVGNCDEPLVATLIKTFDSDETLLKNDLPFRIQLTFFSSREVDASKGYYRTIHAQHAISTLRNVSKNYSVEIPSIPIVWSPAGEVGCHHGGGSGN